MKREASQEIYRFGDDGGVYDSNVVYPFGYGLSYTDFQWELVESETTATGLIEDPEQEISITVKVTNTGKFAGKDVVQLYYSAPYYNGSMKKHMLCLVTMRRLHFCSPANRVVLP